MRWFWPKQIPKTSGNINLKIKAKMDEWANPSKQNIIIKVVGFVALKFVNSNVLYYKRLLGPLWAATNINTSIGSPLVS